MTHCNFEGPEN